MKAEQYLRLAKDSYSKIEEKYSKKLLKFSLHNCNLAIKLNRSYAEAYYQRALVYGLLENFEKKFKDLRKATKLYEQQLELNNNSIELHFKIACVYIDNYRDENHIENAKKHFFIVLNLDPNYHKACYELGLLYQNRIYNNDEALIYYNKAILLKPDESEYYIQRGLCHHEVKNYGQALNDYSMAIELNPNMCSHYNSRGNLYLELEEWENASEDFRKYRNLGGYYKKPKIELLKNVKGGLYFQICLFSDCENFEHWSSSDLYLEEEAFVPFIHVFKNVKEFNYYGETQYNRGELESLADELKRFLCRLEEMQNFDSFFEMMKEARFIYHLIREYDGYENEWSVILENLKIICIGLIDICSEAQISNKQLIIMGI